VKFKISIDKFNGMNNQNNSKCALDHIQPYDKQEEGMLH